MPFSLADAIFWIAVACCAVAQVAILHSVLVSPAPAGTSTPARQGAAARASFSVRRAAEIVWAVLPGIALTVVLVFTWRAIHASPSPSRSPHTAGAAARAGDSIVASRIR
jgi:hypothetical protein